MEFITELSVLSFGAKQVVFLALIPSIRGLLSLSLLSLPLLLVALRRQPFPGTQGGLQGERHKRERKRQWDLNF